MPYIITTSTQVSSMGGVPVVKQSRHAVATLEEAQAAAWEAVAKSPSGNADSLMQERRNAANLHEQGGSVSLPDGTVIEVERVGLKWEMEQAERLLFGATGEGSNVRYTGEGCSPSISRPVTTAEIVAAYNAAQEAR